MALDAGSVFTTLGGRFNPAAFRAFDAANRRAAATMAATETRINASLTRNASSARWTARAVTAAAAEQAAAQRRAAAATTAASAQQVAADQRRAVSARRTAAARTVAATAEAGSAERSAAANVAAARRTAAAWAMVDRAQLALYGSSRMVDQANDRTRRTLTAVGRTAKVGALGVLAFATAATVQGVKGAADLEQQLHVLQATAEATDQQMQAVRARAIELGNDLDLPATSAADAAEAMLELVKGGLSVAEAMDAAKGVLQMSAAAQIANAEAAEYTVDALLAFDLRGREAIRVADLLAAAANATSVEVPQMAQALQQSATVASQLNIPIETTIAMLSQLANAGIKGSDAGTSLKTMLMSLTPVSVRAARAMEDLGVSAFDAEGSLKPVPQLIGEYARALRGLSQEERSTALRRIFGTDAIRAANVILARGVDVHERMTAAVEREGAARDMAAARMRGYRGAWEAINNAWETTTVIIGDALIPKLTELGFAAAGAIGRFADEGGATRLGEQLARGLDIAVDAAADFIRIGGDVAGVLMWVARAMQLTDPDVLVSLAVGIASLRVASTVASGVVSLAAALNALILNARTAPSVMAFLGSLPIGPVGAFAAAVSAVASGLALLALRQESAADQARATAEAFRVAADAARALDDSLLAAADAQFAAQHADRALADAKREVTRALREHGRGSREHQAALEAEKEAAFRATAAHRRAADERRRLAEQERRVVEENAQAIARAEQERNKRISEITREMYRALRFGDRDAHAKAHERLVEAWRRYDAAVQRAAAGTARAVASRLQLHRLMQGQRLLTDGVTRSVAQLARVYDQLPRRVQVQLASTAERDLAQIGSLVGRLREVPRQQVIDILVRAQDARAQIAALSAVLAGVPPRRVIQILERGGPDVIATLQRIGSVALATKIQRIGERGAGGVLGALAAIARANLTPKVQRILGDASSVWGVIGRLASIVLPPLVQTIVTRRVRRAAGRPAGQAEPAIVGEGSRWQGAREAIVDRRTGAFMIVDRPTAIDLTPYDYVIPLDEYRGAAIGLLRMLADDLGVDRFARGRRPTKRAARRGGRRARARVRRSIPARIDHLALPLNEIEDQVRARESRLATVRGRIGSLPGQISATRASIRDIERREASTPRAKANKADDLGRARRRLAGQEKQLRAAKREGARLKAELRTLRVALRRARAHQRQLDRQTELANLAQQDMQIADRRDDPQAFEAARGRRLTALRALQQLLERALRHIRAVRGLASPADAEASRRALQGEIRQAMLDQLDTAADVIDLEETEADRIAETGMTDAQRHRLEDLERDISLARLTQGLDDDRAAQQRLVDFLTGVLEQAQRRGASSPVVRDLADQLHSAQQDLRSLAGGGAHSDQDVQAQLDQERARREAAEANLRVSQRELAAFGSSGDIGTGGFGNALQAGAGGVPQIVVNTLHPADPATLSAIGAAATAGIGLQGGRQPVRQTVGVR